MTLPAHPPAVHDTPPLRGRSLAVRTVALMAVLVLAATGLLNAGGLSRQAEASTVLGNRIADLVTAQVGAVESPLGSNKVPGKPYGNLGMAWCAHFVTWALKAAGVDPAGSGRGAFNTNVARAWSTSGKINGYGRAGTSRNAQVGDLLIDRYDGSSGSGGHISVVTAVNVDGLSDRVITVGGNESDRVVRSKKDLDEASRYLVTIAEVKNGTSVTAPASATAPTTGPYETAEVPAGWEVETISASLGSGTAAASQKAGSLDVFFLDPNARLKQAYYRGGGTWVAGADFGSPANGATGRPGAASWADGRLDVFTRTGSGALAQRYFTNGAWSGWAYPPVGGLATSPAVASWGPGRLDLFSVDSSGRLTHAFFDGQWNPFRVAGQALPSGVALSGGPSAVSWGSGRIDVIAHSTDGRVWQTYFVSGSGWGPWRDLTASTSLRAASGDSVGVSSWGAGRLDVFFKATDGFTWHQWYDSGAWSGYQNMATRSPNGPTPVSWGHGRVDLFYRSTDARLGHDYFQR